MTSKLDSAARAEAMKGLPDWKACDDRDAIQRAYKFKDFKQAFAWMTAAALEAEVADHHPEWENVYNRVDVTLTTHDAGGLTEKDIALAKAMDCHAAVFP